MNKAFNQIVTIIRLMILILKSFVCARACVCNLTFIVFFFLTQIERKRERKNERALDQSDILSNVLIFMINIMHINLINL